MLPVSNTKFESRPTVVGLVPVYLNKIEGIDIGQAGQEWMSKATNRDGSEKYPFGLIKFNYKEESGLTHTIEVPMPDFYTAVNGGDTNSKEFKEAQAFTNDVYMALYEAFAITEEQFNAFTAELGDATDLASTLADRLTQLVRELEVDTETMPVGLVLHFNSKNRVTPYSWGSVKMGEGAANYTDGTNFYTVSEYKGNKYTNRAICEGEAVLVEGA